MAVGFTTICAISGYHGDVVSSNSVRGEVHSIHYVNATFNNISVISWWSVLLVEETREIHQPAQVTDKLYQI
jgi:adenosylmethionine-8-amino-7-oxononanoate aminotransferase